MGGGGGGRGCVVSREVWLWLCLTLLRKLTLFGGEMVSLAAVVESVT